MKARLVDSGWDAEFAKALEPETSELRIICPFIKVDALAHLLHFQLQKIEVITRFNLSDFAQGVSDIASLRVLLQRGARIRGVANLHAKLYLFDKSRAIVTSANLTRSALVRNRELGMIVDDPILVADCYSYFSKLWECTSEDLRLEQVDQWETEVNYYKISGGRPKNLANLGDYGTDVGLPAPPSEPVNSTFTDASQGFVKFLGSSTNRSPLTSPIFGEIDGGDCHLVACYPTNKIPRGVRDNAVIFMGRLTRPNDIRVFGRAIGMAYRPGMDDATSTDIERKKWKSKWSRYIRVHRAEFIDGTLRNAVSLNEMMDVLKANSFASTQRNAERGQGNTNPRHAYSQLAAVKLSADGLMWLNEQLLAAFGAFGKISESKLSNLYWPDY